MNLAELFNKYGSDKDVNGYTRLYHTLFYPRRNDEFHLVEIGIGTMIPNAPSSMVGYALAHYQPGGSLRAWRDFFGNAQIVGLDIQQDTQFEEDRIRTYLCNSTDTEQVGKVMADIRKAPHIIIDDGSHFYFHQLQTLANFFPHLADDGLYIIEDITPNSMLSQNPMLIQNIIGDCPFFFAGLKNNLCVIFKNPLPHTANNW
jgi:hypothetical protein